MTEETVKHIGLPLEEALMNDSPVTACLARIAASTATEEMHKLVNAELNRDKDPSVLLTAMALFAVQTHASVAAQLMSTKGCEAVKKLYEAVLSNEYMKHAQRTHNSMMEVTAL